jgi:hypothetical protein
MLTESTLKDAVLQALDDLPKERVVEVLDFALFLRARQKGPSGIVPDLHLPSVPASQLKPLVGLVAWGGDAVEDSERLYEG